MTREFIRTLMLFLAGVLPVAVVGTAGAAAPMSGGQAPGYYRMMLGDFEVTALSDGTLALHPEQLLTRTTPAKVAKGLARAFLTSPVETSVNAYLINTGSKLVMIDAGTAGLFGPSLGKLIGNLKAAGYQPEQIDEIYITHMHPDHVGGLVMGGQLAFPHAVVRAEQREADFWLSEANLAKAPEDSKVFFKGAIDSLKPYSDKGQFKPFSGDTQLVPGVRAVAARGHTPGHCLYVVESKGQKLVLWGDLIHVAAVQFAEPAVTIKFDNDSKQAAVERKRAFADAAKQGYWIGAAHLSFPGIGRLRGEGHGYAWVPANYTAGK